MISALAWVPKGASRARPVRYEMSQAELDAIQRAQQAEDEEGEDTLQAS